MFLISHQHGTIKTLMQSENLIRATYTSKKTVAFAKPMKHRKNALKSYILQKFMIFCPFRIADIQWECIFIFGETSHIKTWNANETNILIKQMQIIDIHNEYLVVGPTGIFVFYSSTFPLHNVCVNAWFRVVLIHLWLHQSSGMRRKC